MHLCAQDSRSSALGWRWMQVQGQQDGTGFQLQRLEFRSYSCWESMNHIFNNCTPFLLPSHRSPSGQNELNLARELPLASLELLFLAGPTSQAATPPTLFSLRLGLLTVGSLSSRVRTQYFLQTCRYTLRCCLV